MLVADNQIALKAPTLAIDETHRATVPIPMIGLIGRVTPIKWVSLTAKVSGLPLGSYGYVFDGEASIDVNPIKYVGISGAGATVI